MSWTALVPLKPSDARKTRLASALSPEERQALSERMADHVIATLAAHPKIARIVLLSDREPEDWQHDWIRDEGRGLNPELEAARSQLAAPQLLILHADLPMLSAADLDALLIAETAIAPDRFGMGTNALALPRSAKVRLSFGPDSFARHKAQLPEATIVTCPGLALDIDTPDDLAKSILPAGD